MTILWCHAKCVGQTAIYISPKSFFDRYKLLYDGRYEKNIYDELARAGFVREQESLFVSNERLTKAQVEKNMAGLQNFEYSQAMADMVGGV
jgi:virulence-associated protein VapD